MNEENLRKKLLFRCWHRGTREMDLLMGRYAEQALPSMNLQQLEAFADFLEENDPDIYNWVSRRETAPPHISRVVLDPIMDFYAQ